MTVIKIDNNPETFLQTMTFLKKEHPDLAFISYLDGEYGYRVILYNSIVYQFALKQKEQKKFIVGLCFIGNTFFLKHYCDLIIEVQDIAFQWESLQTGGAETDYSNTNHFPVSIPYIGNYSSHSFYKKGYYNIVYEQILINLKLSNIFFTYHCAASIQTSGEYGNFNFCPNMFELKTGKINNNLYSTKNDFFKEIECNTDYNFIKLTSYTNFIKNTEKNDNIVVWIRNTGLESTANMPKEIYTALFSYCIANKKHLYIFLDLFKVPVPENEYLHVCDFRLHNQPLFDEFVKICNKSYLYVGSDSGSSWIASYYTKANCLIYNTQWNFSLITNPQPTFKTKEDLITMLDSKYISSDKLLE